MNAVIEHVATSRDEYLKAIQKQFQALGIAIKNEANVQVAGRDGFTCEYETFQQGRNLRFLTQMIIDRERVYAVTCAALRANFDRYELAFRGCLKSLELP